MTDEQKTTLEKLINDYSIQEVLATMGDICHVKADRLIDELNDPYSAKFWTESGQKLDSLSGKKHWQDQIIANR